MSTSQIFVGALLIVACITDLRTRRIPNALTLLSDCRRACISPPYGRLACRGLEPRRLLLGALLFFPLFALRGMGAGDVKLLAAVGAWLGPSQVATAALATSIAGGVIALAVALGHGYLKTACRNLWMLLTHWRVMGVRPVNELTLEGAGGPRLAYALPIAIGTLVTLWLESGS